MIGKRRGLILLATSALCAVALVPVRVGDARVPGWVEVFHDTGLVLKRAGSSVRQAYLEFRWWHPAEKPKQIAGTPAAVATTTLPQAGPVLDKPQAAQDASALKQAYVAALADERIRALGYDPANVGDAIAAYRADNLAGGDALAAHVSDPLLRTALEWVALREVPQKIGMERLDAFGRAHPDWPTPTWFRHQAEARTARMHDANAVMRFYQSAAPVTAAGKFALAKALKSAGRVADGTKLARALFRESDLQPYLEGQLKAEFGADLTRGDYKYKADRLMYKEQAPAALRYAVSAGPDVVALEKARAAVIAEAPSDKAIAAVPESLRKDPGLILAEVQKLRRADKLMDAANLMQSAPRDRVALIDGDEWWTERRMLARKLLDNGNINAAYVICATASPSTNEDRIESEFHAGWIALRFMNDPSRATYHFAQAAKLAETPTSIARIAYWQARTAAAVMSPDALSQADALYRKAAVYGATYYGQLARQALGLAEDPLHAPVREAVGPARDDAVRTVELLYAAGEKESATALASEMAGSSRDERQLAALATVVQAQGDAHLALTVGKVMGQHGFALDQLAYPTFGIPPFNALQGSAPAPVVYSIARQESAFMPTVISKAGAKGLMQMIDATARHTATKAGLPFDGNRMLTDAAFNAQLGAAHLGELLAEQGGSYILTFAAYNAGGGRVKQWIEAYGDPRKPGVDPIDWVERIPFTETRNYVQRVMANVGMYQAIFAEKARSTMAGGNADREAKL